MSVSIDEAGPWPPVIARWRFAVCAVCPTTIVQRPYTSADGRVELWNPPICAECRRKVDAETVAWLKERYGTELEEAA